MAKYRKKPVVIDAVQFTYEVAMGKLPVPEWLVEASKEGIFFDIEVVEKIHNTQFAKIKTLEGIHIVSPNDYIIQGINEELYPCKPDIFEKTYEKVED